MNTLEKEDDGDMSFGVVLHEPEQPGNTGAIGRTCICAGASLHLIRPLGFQTDEKSVRGIRPRRRLRQDRDKLELADERRDGRQSRVKGAVGAGQRDPKPRQRRFDRLIDGVAKDPRGSIRRVLAGQSRRGEVPSPLFPRRRGVDAAGRGRSRSPLWPTCRRP